jgi:DNA-binding PadR family transcriptional regulator
MWGPPPRRGGGRGGPPPWLAGLFGLAQQERARAPRARRGDVRVAILAVLADGPLNGYQVIQEIADRTGGAWRPSPGSVYPTISQLEDEGLVEGDDERGRRTLRLSDAGRDFLADHEPEVAEVWAPFAEGGAGGSGEDEGGVDFASLKPELGRVMNAVWQIITTGTDGQRRAAVGVLVEARRALYQILADHPGDLDNGADNPVDDTIDDLGDRPGRGADEEEW